MTSNMQAYLIRYGELALKKRNRRRFVDDLVKILKPKLAPLGGRLEIRHQKMMVHCPAPPELVREIFKTVYGITSISPIWRTSHDLDAIHTLAWQLMEPHVGSGQSFAIRAKRPNKQFPHKTPDLERMVANQLLERGLGLKVNLSSPDLSLGMSVENKETWLWLDQWQGIGGLPVSSFNKHGLLLSGGIDSPVAGNLIQKRGGSLLAVYFHTPPYTVPAAEEKVVDLAQKLAQYQNGLDLHVVNFTQAMQAIRSSCDPRYTVILSRRLMMQVATRIVQQAGGKSIITGESLGQVASQTIENISVIGEGVTLPILRPLIGMDKHDITKKAQQIGTFDISVRPFDDCCSLFSPKNPITKAYLGPTRTEENKIPVQELIEQSLEGTQIIQLGSA